MPKSSHRELYGFIRDSSASGGMGPTPVLVAKLYSLFGFFSLNASPVAAFPSAVEWGPPRSPLAARLAAINRAALLYSTGQAMTLAGARTVRVQESGPRKGGPGKSPFRGRGGGPAGSGLGGKAEERGKAGKMGRLLRCRCPGRSSALPQ